ncbi:MAG TPA: MlaD family protein [Solirubrobacteraceae bacterium]|nr:MlaD family protein [Solirubrobacteraceae bacterium]
MRLLRNIVAVVLGAAVVAAIVVLASSSSGGSSSDPTYKVELQNAFGLVSGEQFKVGGVPAGKITAIGLDEKTLHAVVTVQVSQAGFGHFYSDAFCESRPQSLIGEYFLDCSPGHSGHVLKSGSTIPVTHTFSTIPADLLNDIMRLPYRERLTLIVNELGAGVAGNGQNLSAALHRAVPALAETDNLLTLLSNDSATINDLTHNADTLITALANNSGTIEHFINESNTIATETNTQQSNLKATFHDLPPFLEQLKPSLAKLSGTLDANYPVLQNLNSSAGEIDRLLVDLPPFSRSALPALRTLGKASVTGKSAVIAAKPVVSNLNQFATHTPELGQNLAIVLHDLDNRSRATESNPSSPGGKGYTGLEAMLQYVFNQTLDLDYYGQYGHMEAIDAFVSPMCSAYATKQTVANNLSQDGSRYRSCYSWLGPNQPGVNEPDPSNPGACVPDPGGAPPGHRGPSPRGTKCSPSATAAANNSSAAKSATTKSAGSSPSSQPTSLSVPGTSTPGSTSSSPSNGSSPSQPQDLLNYLLGP